MRKSLIYYYSTRFLYNMMLSVPNLAMRYTLVLFVTLNGHIIGRWVILWMLWGVMGVAKRTGYAEDLLKLSNR